MNLTLRRLVFPLFLSALCISTTIARQMNAADIYKKLIPSIVTLNVVKSDGTVGRGSGFMAIREGVAVTAWHVVKNAKSVTAKYSSGEEYAVSGLIDKDEKRDVALVRIKVFGRKLLQLSSKDPIIGSSAFVIGAPRGLEFSISGGLVSQVQTFESIKQFQFSCPASPGNSGGPLIGTKGEVVGVVSWQVRDGQNLNFAVPSIYVLGLDATLPTKPWGSVKAEETIGSSGGEKADRVLAEYFEQHSDLVASCMTAYGLTVMKENGYNNGVPWYMYTGIENAKKVVAQLHAISQSESPRASIAEVAEEDLSNIIRAADLLSEGIRIAQLNGGWAAQARDLVARSQGIAAIRSKADSGTFAPLYASEVFKAYLPELLKIDLGIVPDTIGMRLGVYVWVRNSLLLLYVPEKTLGYELGLRSGDRIISVFGVNPTDLQDFKGMLKPRMGVRIVILVSRDGEDKVLNPTIPRDLDQYR